MAVWIPCMYEALGLFCLLLPIFSMKQKRPQCMKLLGRNDVIVWRSVNSLAWDSHALGGCWTYSQAGFCRHRKGFPSSPALRLISIGSILPFQQGAIENFILAERPGSKLGLCAGVEGFEPEQKTRSENPTYIRLGLLPPSQPLSASCVGGEKFWFTIHIKDLIDLCWLKWPGTPW